MAWGAEQFPFWLFAIIFLLKYKSTILSLFSVGSLSSIICRGNNHWKSLDCVKPRYPLQSSDVCCQDLTRNRNLNGITVRVEGERRYLLTFHFTAVLWNIFLSVSKPNLTLHYWIGGALDRQLSPIILHDRREVFWIRLSAQPTSGSGHSYPVICWSHLRPIPCYKVVLPRLV